jgi:hypothetical protein
MSFGYTLPMPATVDANSPHPLDPIFNDFEIRSGWQLSSQAKAILREGFNSLLVDVLGLGNLGQPASRPGAVVTALNSMPTFLDTLKSKAEVRGSKETKDKVIGGVFVLQNTNEWKSLFDCTCWPI